MKISRQRHTQTHRSLIETFQRSQMSFSIRRTHSKDGTTWEFWKSSHPLYCVFKYIYSLPIEKDICDHQSVSIKLPCVCMCLLSGYLFIFLVRFSSFFSYFSVLSILWYFSFHGVSSLYKVTEKESTFQNYNNYFVIL